MFIRPVTQLMTATSKQKESVRDRIVDRDRWEGVVIGEKTETVSWGTHEFTLVLQEFDDGGGHLTVEGPGNPPPCAREIISDWLNAGDWFEIGAVSLADQWDIDIEEVSR